MTTRRKTILAVSAAALAVALVATPLVFARGGGMHGCPLGMGGRGHHGFGAMATVLRELDLTEQQKEALHQIHDTAREQNAAAKSALHDGFMEAARILIADPNNVAAARTAIQNREAAIRQLKDNGLNAISQALAVLTPEQRAKLATHLEEHHRQMTR